MPPVFQPIQAGDVPIFYKVDLFWYTACFGGTPSAAQWSSTPVQREGCASSLLPFGYRLFSAVCESPETTDGPVSARVILSG